MKKIIFTLAIIIGGALSAQDYYDSYPTDYNGYEYYNNSYDYPDDYYYNYPTDYYPDQYYQGYYNDYRQAVYGINWNQFFSQYRLTPWQMDQIIALNNRFASFAAWDMYYRYNPDRWYYDRFFALQNILGPQIFVIYQNNYFRGRSPIVFYRNRFANFYARRYPVRPVYRNVNINIYRVDRNNFREGFRNQQRNMGMIDTRNNGMINPQNPRSGANGNNMGAIRSSGNSGVRNQNDNIRNNGNIRVEPQVRENSGVRNSGFPRGNSEVRTQQMPSERQQSPQNNGGFRQNQNSGRSIENRSREGSGQRNSAPAERGGRSSGMRLASK